jgi:hypothetical protein
MTSNNAKMKTFIILQKIVLFRADWRNLIPSAQSSAENRDYRIILLVHEPTYEKLAESQKHCFEHIFRIKTFDFENVKTTVQQIMSEYPGETRIITNDELCIDLAANVRAELSLPGDTPELVQPFINKTVTKAKLASSGIRLPKFIHFDPKAYAADQVGYVSEIESTLKFPIFAKPINSAASQCTTLLTNLQELIGWCQVHQADDNFELDEYIEGVLFHCESVIRDNEIVFAQAGENAHPCFDFMSGKVTGSIALPDDDLMGKQILAFNRQVITALKTLPNCVTHLEVFRKHDGELVFLEIACRAPGGMIVQMHQYHCGINFEEAHFRMQMGLPFDASITPGPNYAWAWFPNEPGTVAGFASLPIKSDHQITWKVEIGDKLTSAESLVDYAGGVILWNDNYDDLRNDFTSLTNFPTPFILTDERSLVISAVGVRHA